MKLILLPDYFLVHLQTLILPYVYHKKSKEEEKLETIETKVTELKANMADTGSLVHLALIAIQHTCM